MASNRVNDPAASYTGAGNLLCTVCRAPVKSSALWPAHIESERHIKLSQSSSSNTRRRKRSPEPEDRGDSKDRKRVRSDQDAPGERVVEQRPRARNGRPTTRSNPTEEQQIWKRAVEQARLKSVLPSDFLSSSSTNDSASTQGQMLPPPRPPVKKARVGATRPPAPIAQPQQSLDEELLAFEQDIAAIPTNSAKQAEDQTDALSAPLPSTRPAALTALPQYASNFLPTGGEEPSNPPASLEESNLRRADRQKKEEEEENEEREDRLRNEFEEMQGLEEKVKLLKEKREALRIESPRTVDPGGMEISPIADASKERLIGGVADESKRLEEEDGSGSGGDDDDNEFWAFR